MPSASPEGALVHALQVQPTSETAWRRAALATQLVVPLVPGMPTEKLPGHIAQTQAEYIIIEAAARRPGWADVVPSAFHARRLDVETLTIGIRTRRVGRCVAGPHDYVRRCGELRIGPGGGVQEIFYFDAVDDRTGPSLSRTRWFTFQLLAI